MNRTVFHRRSAGFTLLETLISVAIVVVMSVAAIPAVSSLTQGIRINELDASAREIYLAAQNQLIALRTGGNPVSFSEARQLSASPDDSMDGVGWTSLRYLSSADTSDADELAALLPSGAIDPAVAENEYVIEFNPENGSVYAVFYSNEAFAYQSDLPRDRVGRRTHNPMLGYYGGGSILTGGVSATALSAPKISVVNGETLELGLSFAGKNPFDDVDDGTFFRNLSCQVTICSATDPGSASCTFSSSVLSSPVVRYPGTYSFQLVLDSLSNHFSTLCPGITPGDDLNITVTTSYGDETRVTRPASASLVVNSLFSSRTGDTVFISGARHLQNLEPNVSGVSGVTAAVQTSKIDWAGSGMDFVPISNSALASYNGSGLSISNLTAGANGGYSGLFGLFSGGSLSNIHLTGASVSGGACAGALAGKCEGETEVSHCAVYVGDDQLERAGSYTVTGSRYVGGLIGYADSLRIFGSFAAPGAVSGGASGGDLGGLVGYLGGGTVSRCYADTDLTGAAGADLGGLIGHNTGSAVTDCYALGTLTSPDGTLCGGLAGRSSGGSYTACYAAAGFGSGSSTAYGFSGSSGGSFRNCAYLQTDGVSGGTPDNRVNALSFEELKAWTGGSWTGTLPANSHPYSAALRGLAYPFPCLSGLEHYNDWPEGSGGTPSLPTRATFVYYETYPDGTTGYYATGADGNILIDTLSDSKGALVDDGYGLLSPSLLGDYFKHDTWYTELYFEHESGSGMEDIWYGDEDGNPHPPLTVTIMQDSQTKTYYRYDVPKWFLLWSCDDYAVPGLYEKIVFPLRDGDLTCWYSPHSAKAVVNNALSAPAFDGSIVLRSARQLTMMGISALGNVFWAEGVQIRQELDLDYTRYDPYHDSIRICIGESASRPFSGSYDGMGHVITAISNSRHDSIGLFGCNRGTLRNVNLRFAGKFLLGSGDQPSGALTGSNMGAVERCTVTFGTDMDIHGAPAGLLAGRNTGTITDCLVTAAASSSTVKNDSGPLAGFAGENTGSITRCHVRPGVSSYAGFSLESANASGFVGSNSGTVTNCSFTGSVTAGDYSTCHAAGFVLTNTGTVTGSYANCLTTGYYAAGFAYDSSASSAIIQNSYAMLEVSGSSSNGGGAAGFVMKGSAKVSDCYAVTQVTGVRSDLTYSFTGDTAGTNCGYFSWKNCGYHLTGTGLHAEDFAARYHDPAVWRASTSANTHVYLDRAPDLGSVCPYPILVGADHYGGWLEEPYYVPPFAMFVYYEQYSDNSYGYYGLGADGSSVLLDTLSDTAGPVKLDGYAYFSPVLLADRNAKYQTSASDTGSVYLPDPGDLVSLTVNGNTEPYYCYLIPTGTLYNNHYVSADYYQSIRISDVTFWYNPHFAKAAVTGAAGLPSFGGEVSIRSPRQLAALGNASNSAYWGRGYTFRQELDLDFPNAYGSAKYMISISSTIGTSSGASFTGLYDGAGHAIVLDSNAKGNKNALFGYNSGTLKNLTIRLSGDMSMGSGGAVSGILSATNAGFIQNCSVIYAGSLTANGSRFGSLAGSNSGTISSCLVTGSGSSAVSGYGVELGGCVGENLGAVDHCHVRPGSSSYSALTFSSYNPSGFAYRNNGTISDCSATATVTAPNNSNYYAAGFVSQNNGTVRRSYANCVTSGFFAAGFAYNSVADASSIEDCYAMLKVSSNVSWSGGGAAGFVYNGNGNIRGCYAAARVSGYRSYTFSAAGSIGSDCYYLNWDGCGSTSTGTGCGYSALYHAFDGETNWGDAQTHVYRDQYASLPDVCPFPLITGLDHYGDWPAFPPVLPEETPKTLGIFYYRQEGDGTCYITAGSVQYVLTSSGNAAVASTSSRFLRSFVDLSSYLSAHSLPDSGFGVFWSKDLDYPNKFSVNDTDLSTLDTGGDLGLSSYYYFVPFDGAKEIGFSHDNSEKRDWDARFDYALPADAFSITVE